MALSNEDLLAISQLLDAKLLPVQNELHETKPLIENDILPRLGFIVKEEHYGFIK